MSDELNLERPDIKYVCRGCGGTFTELPLCFGSDYPPQYYDVPAIQRKKRIELEESLCVIDGQFFFHRGSLAIPINDHNENLIFNVWATISEDDFGTRMDRWRKPERINDEPYKGILQSSIPGYGKTLNIEIVAKEREVGVIPEIKVVEPAQVLRQDQEQGISFERAQKIVCEILHEQQLE